MVQAANLGEDDDPTGFRSLDGPWLRGIPVQAQMRSALVKVVHEALFEFVAGRLQASEPDAEYRRLADTATEVLRAAEAEGYPRCSFTQHHIEAFENLR
jgi:hypothetical protein